MIDPSRSRRPRTRALRTAIAGLVLTLLAARLPHAAASDRDPRPAPSIVFSEVAAQAGVRFRFDTGSRGQHDLPEIMGGGVALLDADGDGLLDIYLCNGGPIAGTPGADDPPCRFYRNRGGLRFDDATAASGAPGPNYAMGAAVGDYDNDGRVDLFVTGWRDQRLYRNLGGGRFEDVTERAGLRSKLWSMSAAFGDLDGDGDLDLYVATYVEYNAKSPPYCAAPDGRHDYCGPEEFPAQPDRLYRNNGDGTFTDISALAGIDQPPGRGLGVLIAELTGDNRPDIYVANDGTPCWLFANRGDLHFTEAGEAAGVARDGQGQPLAGMGVTAGDLDGDGQVDFVVTNFYNRCTIAFRRDPQLQAHYHDDTSRLGLDAPTRPVLGFGAALVDFDGDGRLDLIQTNGHVLDRARLGVPFAMRPLLLRNAGAVFEDVSRAAGSWFDRPILGRGLAVGDLDGDNKPDVVANALDAPAALLHNTCESARFLGLDVIDRFGRPAIGASVRVVDRGHGQVGELAAGGSYLAASQPRLWVGLAHAHAPLRIEVAWPWGVTETWTSPIRDNGGRLRLKEGTGQPKP
jgi:hypothetical protein